MDSCGAMDTHNDLPYTFVKYQTGNDPTEVNVGIDMDQSHNDLYSNEILEKSRGDSHTSKIFNFVFLPFFAFLSFFACFLKQLFFVFFW